MNGIRFDCHLLLIRVASVLVKAALPWAGVHVLSGSGGGTLMVGLAEWRDTTP